MQTKKSWFSTPNTTSYQQNTDKTMAEKNVFILYRNTMKINLSPRKRVTSRVNIPLIICHDYN